MNMFSKFVQALYSKELLIVMLISFVLCFIMDGINELSLVSDIMFFSLIAYVILTVGGLIMVGLVSLIKKIL